MKNMIKQLKTAAEAMSFNNNAALFIGVLALALIASPIHAAFADYDDSYGAGEYDSYSSYDTYPSYSSYDTYDNYDSYDTYPSYSSYDTYDSYDSYDTYPSYSSYDTYDSYDSYQPYSGGYSSGGSSYVPYTSSGCGSSCGGGSSYVPYSSGGGYSGGSSYVPSTGGSSAPQYQYVYSSNTNANSNENNNTNTTTSSASNSNTITNNPTNTNIFNPTNNNTPSINLVVLGGGGSTQNQQQSLEGSCVISPSTAYVGQNVNFSATASGGNGSYTYYWTGDNGISASSQSFTGQFTYAGSRSATVTITSNGHSITRSCSVNVQAYQQSYPTYPSYPTYQPSNVTVLQQPVPTVGTPVSGVFLSQVPATGVGFGFKMVLFSLGILMWSAFAAYVIGSKRKGALALATAGSAAQAPSSSNMLSRINAFKAANMKKKGIEA